MKVEDETRQLMDSDPLTPSGNDDSGSKTDIVPAVAPVVAPAVAVEPVVAPSVAPAVAPETGEDVTPAAAEVVDCDRSRDCKDNAENKLCLPPESGEGKGSCVTKDVMNTTMAARGQATRDARAAAATAVGATGMNPADLFEENDTPGPDDVVPFDITY